MDEKNMAEKFEASRAHLRAVAFRMLGSVTEADDAIQEAWLKVSRAGSDQVDNFGGWMTTIVARVCLDMLRARKSRREDPDGAHEGASIPDLREAAAPDHEAVVADSVGVALLIVLETLAPAERLAFVLHDMFDLPFEEIAPIVGSTPTAARQLANRARRRVQGADARHEADLARKREVVDAFLTASRSGDLTALLTVLDPNVVFRADPAAVAASVANQGRGAPKVVPEARGANVVADAFAGRAKAAQAALIDGSPGVVWAPGGTPRAVFAFTIEGGQVTAIDLVSDPERIRTFDVELFG